MAATAKKGRITRTPSARSSAVERENVELRAKLEAQAVAQQALTAQLAVIAPTIRPAAGQLMVGLRNISDYTIGIPATNPGETEIELHPTTTGISPYNVAVMPYAQWQVVRKGKLMEQGMIMRDDSVLGSSYQAAPADRPGDIAPGWSVNAIPNPEEWVASKSEAEIRETLDRITSDPTLQRLRRVVDGKLRELQNAIPKDDPNRARKALQRLPAIYQLIDQVVTMRLELKDGEQEG